jgi:hypothetical protein
MKIQQTIAIILIGIMAAVAVNRAMQPDAGLLKFRVKGDKAYGYGSTNDWSVSQITSFMDENPQVGTLVLKKMSGTTDADMNLRLAYRIRERGLKTHLDSDSFIASGAVDLFLAGVERTMECGALIGVHSWSMSGSRDTIRISPKDLGTDRRQKMQETFLKDMGIDPAFYAFTREAAEPEKLHFLTPEEIERFGLLTQPVDCT